MTETLRQALARAGRLLRYPDADYPAAVAAATEALLAAARPAGPETPAPGTSSPEPGTQDPARDTLRAAAADLAAFARAIEGRSVAELQELFTRTFDLNPLAALEVGWHLYGEDYERGAFLVRMRERLRRHEIDEAGELPDHLASLVVLLARLPAGEAAELAATAVGPAVERMLPPLEAVGNTFAPLLKAVWGLVTACAPQRTRSSVDEVAHA